MFFEAVLPQRLWDKINQKINYSKLFLISPLNSIIKEQSTTLGSDAPVIDRKIIDEIEKKRDVRLITTNQVKLPIYFSFTLLISLISACLCVLFLNSIDGENQVFVLLQVHSPKLFIMWEKNDNSSYEIDVEAQKNIC